MTAKDLKTTVLKEALAATRQISNDWQQQRALRGLARLLDSNLLTEAQDIASKLQDPLCRARALVELARYLPGQKQTAAVQEALQAIRQVPAGSERASTLNALAGLLAALAQQETGLEALEAIRGMADAQEQAWELAALPAVLARQAVATANQIEPAWVRALALGGLASKMPKSERGVLLEKALRLAEEAPELEGRLTAWSDLIPRLTGALQTDWALRALTEAGTSQDAITVFEVLRALAEYLPAEALPDAVALARRIELIGLRAEALAVLIPYLPKTMKEQILTEAVALLPDIPEAWACADAIIRLGAVLSGEWLAAAYRQASALQDPWARASALSSLAKRLEGQERETAFEEALASARQSTQAWTRARALTFVAAAL